MLLRARLVCSALLAAACVPVQQINLPIEAETTDHLVISEPIGAPLRVYAFRPGDPLLLAQTIPAEGGVLTVLVLPLGTLDRRLINSGPVEVVAEDRGGRALPQGQLFVADLKRGAFDGWTKQEELSETLRELFITALDLGECGRRGGCLDPRSPGDCVLGCDPQFELPELVVAAPLSPELPRFTKCTVGWEPATALSSDSIGGCLPIGIGTLCDDETTTSFFGEAACTPIGGPCPNGPYAAGLPLDAILLTPLDDVQAAIDTAADGAVIALAKGDYVQSLVIQKPIELIGACVAETRIRAANDDPTVPVIHVINTRDVVIKNLHLYGGRSGVFSHSSTVSIEQVLLDGNGYYGLHAAYGHVTADHLVARAATEAPIVAGLGVLDMTDVVVERAPLRGLVLTGVNTRGRFERVVLRDVVLQTLYVAEDAELDATDLLIERSGSIGVVVEGRGGVLFQRAAIDRTSQNAEGAGGQGIYAYGSGRVTARQLIVRDSQFSAVHVIGSELDLSDLIIRGVAAGLDGNGSGFVTDGSKSVLSRVLIEDIATVGLFGGNKIEAPESFLRASDVTVLDVRGSGEFSGGIRAFAGSMTLDRTRVARYGNQAIEVRAPANASLTDVIISGLQPVTSATRVATGIDAEHAPIRIERALIEDVDCHAVLLRSGAEPPCPSCQGELRDVTLRRTTDCDHVHAASLLVVDDVRLDVQRLRIEDAERHGIRIEGVMSSTATIEGLSISRAANTAISFVDDRTLYLSDARIDQSGEFGINCSDSATFYGSGLHLFGGTASGKSGVYALHGCAFALEDFLIDDAANIGIQFTKRIEPPGPIPSIVPLGSLFLQNGVVRGHDTGVSIIGDVPDPWDVLDHVLLQNNEVAFVHE